VTEPVDETPARSKAAARKQHQEELKHTARSVI
jgi:hypothetical protein